MKKFAPYFRIIGFLAICIVCVAIFEYALVPSGYIRYILHQANDAEENYDCIVLGASHARSAIDPNKIDAVMGTNTLNMAIPGETIKDSYYLLKQASLTNDIKTVILDVDYQYWFADQPEYNNISTAIMGRLNWADKPRQEYLIDSMGALDYRDIFTNRVSYTLNPQEIKQNIVMKSSDEYKNYSIEGAIIKDADGPYMGKGFFYRETSGSLPGGHAYVESWVGRENGFVEPWVANYFSQINNFCKSNGIELICVTSPITPSAAKLLKMDKVHTILDAQFQKFGVTYYDFNAASFEALPRTDYDYGDMEGHMGGDLAGRYSNALGNLLFERQSGTLDTSKYFSDFKIVFNETPEYK